MPITGYFETALANMENFQPRYIRIDHIYDYYDVYQKQPNGEIYYDWENLDRVVDAILATGAEPLMTLSYMPPELGLNGTYGPPHDYAVWEELVFQTVYHFNVERGLHIQYWEVWNEPNLTQFWNGSLPDYLKLYEASVNGAKRADDSIKIGGPATASREFNWSMSRIHEHNWISELVDFVETNDLSLDFVSWHLYDSNPHAYTRSVDHHRDWVNEIKPPPELFLTEWNWHGGTSSAHDDGSTVAYVGAIVNELLLTPLDRAYFFEPIDGAQEAEGFWGLMRRDGTPKPIFYAFELLSHLSGEYFAVETNHNHVNAIATQNGNRIAIVVWNFEAGHAVKVDIQIENLHIPIAVQLYGVDADATKYTGNNVNLLFDESLSLHQNKITLVIPENSLRLIEFEISPQ